jgi:uncharacterized protein YfaS (alpha-2-macroglobulin family)
MGFSTEQSDRWWWLMASPDTNAVRAILVLLARPGWREDIPRLVRGAIGRQREGRWSTTPANVWGVLAMERFSEVFEAEPVTGSTEAALGAARERVEWRANPAGGSMRFAWPAAVDSLRVTQQGTGRPWLTVQSLAAVPLRAPVGSGYRIERSVAAVQQQVAGRWSRGDVMRVTLAIDAQTDMTWVVVADPVPAGATILGRGLARDSTLLAAGEQRSGRAWPEFEERASDAYRAYYRFVPKGRWTLEYTVRLNSEGRFGLPPTRVEAMYAPELSGEFPNADLTIGAP